MARMMRRKTQSKHRSGTASPDEIARFAAMADTWWDADGEFKPLHKLNPVRIAFVRDRVVGHFRLDESAEQPFGGLDLIDIGCGGGLLSEPMRRLGATVTGIDAAEQNIQVAGLHAVQSGLDIDYRCVLPEVLAETGSRFDVVVNMEVVEHVADLDAFLEACCTLLRPGGVMVISTINRTLKSLALAKLGAEYVLRWIPPGTHDWRKFVRPSELAAGLRPYGVEIVALKGMTYGPFRDDWFLSSDLDVNYLAFAVKA